VRRLWWCVEVPLPPYTLPYPNLPNATRQAGAAPPQVVLRAELHVGADERHLDRDEHGQHAHHEAEAKDVVEVPLPAGAAASAARAGRCDGGSPAMPPASNTPLSSIGRSLGCL